ncbi:putative histone deacetylation protein Rxt3 [Helianthus anomalus]
MSGTPSKRVHEDSGGHSSLSRYSHPPDDSGTYSGIGGANSKLPNPSAPTDYHTSFDTGHDARMPKVPRTELDSRRPPLLQMYRMQQPSSLTDSQSDHPVNPEERAEIRDSLKVENRDVNAESKELYQGAKIEKEVRYTGRGDDHKETKYERNAYSDYRNEVKTDKDGYNPVNSNVNVKESKEHHRTWKYPDTTSGNMDPWHASRSNTEGLNTEAKDHNAEAHETVSENKVDSKGDDVLKERDRKRKDAKHREWGENNKERIEARNNEMKDPTKEDRKDALKDKEKVKDHGKRDTWVVNEKDGLQPHEKEDLDVSSSRGLDLGKQKSTDNERGTEKDADNEGERSERRNKGFDKDSDDGGADVEGSADREREGFSYGVQQRKRMLRPRGSPQVANRDPRFRSRPQDNDGSTGKSDVSTVVYRVGECMQELLNLWNGYKSSNETDKTSESSKSFPTLEIRIPAEHVTATNRQVKGGQLWGTDIYTHDSDLVAVLMHTGYCRPTASPPPPAIQELRTTVRVLPPQDCYVSTLRNNVRSRAWGAAIDSGCSFRVERCHIVKKAGGTIDLEPCLTHTSTVEPTLAPVVVERTMTTRAAASNALRQQRFVREVTLQYNLCNEPWIKYSISAIADKGLKKPLFTSARLKKGEVLYLESPTQRFELCFNGEKMVKSGNEMDTNGVDSDNNNNNHNNNGNNSMMDVFRWSLCKKPLPQTLMRSIGIPLPPEHLKVLEENLDWEDIQWSQTGVWIAGKEYPLSRVHFLSPA